MRAPTRLRDRSPQGFARFGIEKFVYMKRVVVDGAPAYALHAADGTELLQTPESETALAIARENDLEAVSVH
jgi:hypothetical protein